MNDNNIFASINDQYACAFICGIIFIIIIQLLCKYFGAHEFYDPNDPNDRKRTDYAGTKYYSYDTYKAAWAALLSDSAAPDMHRMSGQCDPDQFDPNQSYDISNKKSPGNLAARMQPLWAYQYGPGQYDPSATSYHNYSTDDEYSALLFNDVNY